MVLSGISAIEALDLAGPLGTGARTIMPATLSREERTCLVRLPPPDEIPDLPQPLHVIVPDFCSPDRRSALEVLGFDFHGSREELARTSRREKAYRAMGYELLSITAEELYDLRQFNAAMTQLAQMLGTHLPRLTRQFVQRRTMLRKEVLGIGRP